MMMGLCCFSSGDFKMPAITTRQQARERLLKTALSAIDRLVPADESVPLRGSTFADFENQTYEVGDAILTAMMEERAKLARCASVAVAGLCPHCGSHRTYLEDKGTGTQQEIRSPSGPVLIAKQGARCRACNGSFSPSVQRLDAVFRSAAQTQGRPAHRARGRDANV
jgi:hypothetical protein